MYALPRSIVFSLLLVVLVLTGGCSSGTPLVKVKGKLVDGGQPVGPDPNRSFTLIFVPQNKEATAETTYVGLITEPGGEFELAGPDLKGVPIGTYRVKIQTTDPSPSARVQAIQKRYSHDRSPIIVDIQSPEPLVIDLAKFKGP